MHQLVRLDPSLLGKKQIVMMLSFQHPITYKFYSQVDPNHSFFHCFPWLISHIHLKHSIHHQLSFVFAFQWPSFYHTDQSVASQPHLKPTCIRPASTGVSTVFPSPGASYILPVNKQTQSEFKPVPPHMQKHEYQAQLLWHPANASAPAKSFQSY